jgi:hypothetical protein
MLVKEASSRVGILSCIGPNPNQIGNTFQNGHLAGAQIIKEHGAPENQARFKTSSE